ncbi:hypothetical protein I6F35_28060 [Bradyrhizobium sp. BRP22]|uniref:hypothetical protein n=1 Tax=Bradyrhizobium sp. BRP22 TaxID=2793821 RepID=UPI001CD6A36B|nr:hypothetical protein [Bradyrhizobium sp. BRP22]MCA1457029.1 hypothetical protein [Bradyrhizobium sp. BRP22]
MRINRVELNATEQKVHDIVMPRLEGLANILVLKQQDDRIRLDVVSQHHFQRTAAELEEACEHAAKATSCSFDVTVTTHWPATKENR